MRLPATRALYHHFENPLFEAALEHVVSNPDCFVGSMNREAAVLGTPTYSLFKGKLAAVDRHLIERGRMVRLDEMEKIPLIRLKKKYRGGTSLMKSKDLVEEVAEMFLGN
ncbi:MAG: DUF354 domain-containing protein [Deltaproteobacteria bacterium]|nr:DUF354 domain-containing protein [Deltaproteobacteria bacterium]